jgi:dTDP-3,4-didehydro-2,6-dideoxy-alpha-D-glucose 3-reductase
VSPDPVRIGVLGCASIAWRRTLPAVAAVPELTVVAVASRDPAKAARFAAPFGAEPVHGYQALLERADLDAVYLPLPTGLHYEWAARALRAGKHVLCEKPLATNLAEATELVELAAKSRLVLRENFMFLYHSQHRRIRELLDAGAIGEPRTFTAAFGIPPVPGTDVRYDRELGGGALLDVGVYPIRAAQLFLGSGVRVAGAVLHHEAGIDVAGSALLASDAGITAQLSFGFQHHYRSSYELWGRAGRIVLDRAFTPPNDWTPTVRLERPGGVEELTLPADDQFHAVTTAFARAVQAGAGTEVPDRIEDGGTATLRQAALVDAVRQAAGY